MQDELTIEKRVRVARRVASFISCDSNEWKHPPPFPKNDFGLSQGTGGGWFLVRITPFSPI